MTESSSSAGPPEDCAAPKHRELFLLNLVTGATLLALALAVFLLRLHRLGEIPEGIDAGEGANGVDALRVLQGEHAVFFPDKFRGREGMVVYAMALAVYLLGRTELALHLPTALAGAGTVFVVFWLGRALFGTDESGNRAARWRGLFVGAAGAGLLAVSLGQTIIARTAYRTTLLPLLLALCMVLLWEGWKRRSKWHVVLAGISAGLLPYTYIPARFAPFLFLLFGLSFVLSFSRRQNGLKRAIPFIDTSRMRAELTLAAPFAVAAVIVAAPILLHFALNPEHFVSRASLLFVLDPTLSQGDPIGAFLINIWHHLLAFGFRGDPFWRNNFAGQPMLNSWETFSFWLGVGIAARRWQHPAYRLLLLWLAVLLLPAFLSSDPDGLVPNTVRMIGTVPAVYLLIGVGIWETYHFLRSKCLTIPKLGIPAYLTSGTLPGAVLGAVVGCLILVQGSVAFRTYFGAWASAPQTYRAYDQEWTDLARALNAQPTAADTVYLIPYPWPEEPYGFHYLYQGASPVHIFPEATARELTQMIRSKLEGSESIATVKVVEWKEDPTGEHINVDDRIVAVLSMFARHQGSEDGDIFLMHNFADIDQDRPWALSEHPVPVEVHFDGGISLLGLDIGQGPETLPTSLLFDMGNGQPMWMVLQWQTAPGLDLIYSISIRLHDHDGGVVYQKDAVLTRDGIASTRHWKPDELVQTLHLINLPHDLTTGEYELRLVVYDFESLKPTVELGVWQAETVLARLRLTESE